MSPPYVVRRSDEFVEQLRAIEPQDARLEEVLVAIEDALARNPFVGRRVSPGIMMLVGRPPRALPIAFYYSYDGTAVVTLRGVRQVKM